MQNPNLYTITDYRDYIRAWLAISSTRSLQRLADKVGCSKSQVAHIVSGRRALQEHWISAFCDAMGLTTHEERDYFKAMVLLAESPDRARRRTALGHVLSVQRFKGASPISADTYELFSRWYYLVIAELAQCTGFRDDPDWIAATVYPPITAQQATEALDALERMGLLVRGPAGLRSSGVWSAGHDVHEQVVAMALNELHPTILSLAAQAVESVPGEARQLEFITFAMPSAQLPALKELVRRFQTDATHLVTGMKGDRDQVYQLCVQLFPASTRSQRDA